MAAIATFADGIFRHAKAQGRAEPLGAYAFDALVELAVQATAAAPGANTAPAGVPTAGDADPPVAALSEADPSEPSVAGSPPAEPVPESPLARLLRPTKRPGQWRGARRGAPVKLLVRVDYDALLSGVVAKGEVCELAGYGPVPVSVVRDLIASGDPFVAAILTKGRQLVGVAHLGRQPTALQQSALEWLYPSCAVLGCRCVAHLQRDHRIDWSKTHLTMLDHLDLLCSFHHGLKTRDGWALVEGVGKRAFVPPPDPRHPNNSKPAALGSCPVPTRPVDPGDPTGATPTRAAAARAAATRAPPAEPIRC